MDMFESVKTAARPPLENAGDADVKADWPHDLVQEQTDPEREPLDECPWGPSRVGWLGRSSVAYY